MASWDCPTESWTFGNFATVSATVKFSQHSDGLPFPFIIELLSPYNNSKMYWGLEISASRNFEDCGSPLEHCSGSHMSDPPTITMLWHILAIRHYIY